MTSVELTDLDSDGDLDIVWGTTHSNSVGWIENNGGSWTSTTWAENVHDERASHVIDIDGDGDLDALFATWDTADERVRLFENNGAADPSFTRSDLGSSSLGRTHSVYAADLDNDGDIDYVTANELGDDFKWHENDGGLNPTFTDHIVASNIDGAHDIFIIDVDNDGDLDIIGIGEDSDTVHWFENNCDGNDPLIFDLDGDGIELLGVDAHVNFDVDVDGELEATGWAAPDDGLLVMDLDQSGGIENMSEVFSEHFDTGGFNSSLDALASLDSNKDNFISKLDNFFGWIQIWKDSNSDGISSASELSTLEELDIESISLVAESINQNIEGNQLDAFGTYQNVDGTSGIFAQATFAQDGLAPRFSYAGSIGRNSLNDQLEYFDPSQEQLLRNDPSSQISTEINHANVIGSSVMNDPTLTGFEDINNQLVAAIASSDPMVLENQDANRQHLNF